MWSELEKDTVVSLSALEAGPILVTETPSGREKIETAPWVDFVAGAAEPFLQTVPPTDKAKALVLLAEAAVSAPRQLCWPLELALCVRMVRHHLDLRDSSSGKFRKALDLERVPIVIYSAQSLRKLLQRQPRFVLAASPSVSIRKVEDVLAGLPREFPPAATLTELRDYLPPFDAEGRTVLHDLGNQLGPALALQYLHCRGACTVRPHGSSLLRTLAAGAALSRSAPVEDVSARTVNFSGAELYLADDHYSYWEPVFRGLGATIYDAIRAKKGPIDLLRPDNIVLFDLRLDDRTGEPLGLTLLQKAIKMREDHPERQARLLAAFTSSSQQRFRHELENAGVDVFLHKPCKPDETKASIDELVKILAHVMSDHARITTNVLSGIFGAIPASPFFKTTDRVAKELASSRIAAIRSRRHFRMSLGAACLLRDHKQIGKRPSYKAVRSILHGIVHEAYPVKTRAWKHLGWSVELLCLAALAHSKDQWPQAPAQQGGSGRSSLVHDTMWYIKDRLTGNGLSRDPNPNERVDGDDLLAMLWCIRYLADQIRSRPEVAALTPYLKAAVKAIAKAFTGWTAGKPYSWPSEPSDLQDAQAWATAP
jgi:CheY-like chemotaxis protein